ncbi:MAG: phosphatidate cytidylyltransferase [Gammaproteobacteria bacterium]|nr:phosphatidate cytidylyltransferase [Gammaproteobacteria bacterium]MDH3429666.1 phosphatidate cytidylyltransferase [Gammaproteobacteria bacterium]MDH3433456.1 phosphatidate cytidylyltransferase [Gammaproteobacteria bacterium]
MKQRVITAVIALATLLLVLFALPEPVVSLVVVAVILAGAWEWSAFLELSGKVGRFTYVAVIGAALAAVSFLPVDAQSILKVSLVWWLLALIWTFFFPTPVPAALRWLAGAAVLVPLYLALIILYDAAPMILLFALLIVWVADSGAFFAGKMLGRVKLAPKISPGKTWEGVIGGLLAVVLLTLLRSLWVETDLGVLIPFCLAVACLSIVGDLTVSMFKRTAGLKDSGSLFPGHGGVLDRIDSVAAAAPLFALGVSWAGLK